MTKPDSTARGVEAVLVGPLEVDYTAAANAPQLATRLLTDLLPGGQPPTQGGARVVDEVTMTRALAALRGLGLHPEPGGHTIRVAQRLAADPFTLRVGVVGAAGQSLPPDLTFVGDLDRHGIDRTHVTATSGLSGITLSIPGPAPQRLVYDGANQHLAAMLRDNRPAIVDYAASARQVHLVAPADASAVDAVGQLLVAVRRANPTVCASIDASLCREPSPGQLAALLTLADLAIVNEQDLHDLAGSTGVQIGRGGVDAVLSARRHRQPGLVVAYLDPTGVTVRCPCHSARTLPITPPAGSPNSERAVSLVLAHLVAAGPSCDERIAALQAGIDAIADSVIGQPGDSTAATPPPAAAVASRWWPPSQWFRR